MEWIPKHVEVDSQSVAALTERIDRIAAIACEEQVQAYPFLVKALAARAAVLEQFAREARQLEEEGVKVVFVAPKGAGKSSVLNGLLGTWTKSADPAFGDLTPSERLTATAVLPLGSGGTTPCEVHFEYAEAWSVEVERETDDVVNARIDALAAAIFRDLIGVAEGQNTADEANIDLIKEATLPVAYSSESTKLLAADGLEIDIRRCILGICGGSRVRALAAGYKLRHDGPIAFRDELLLRADYANRQPLMLQSEDAGAIDWLKSTLNKLTWGNQDLQPFPSRIIVRGPTIARTEGGGCRIRLVDSLGLRSVAQGGEPPLKGRRDLDVFLSSPWTVAVFVAGYTNPPEPVQVALQYAFKVAPELLPARRLVVPLLYKGEAILIDQDSDDPRQKQRESDAKVKQDQATGLVNQLLGGADKPRDWDAEYSPVIDLLGSLGPSNTATGLGSAINNRLAGLAEAWSSALETELASADRLLEQAEMADELLGQVNEEFQKRMESSRRSYRRFIDRLEACPVEPFAVACNSRRFDGKIAWNRVLAIGSHGGNYKKEDPYQYLADEIKGQSADLIRSWRNSIRDARYELREDADELYRAFVETAAQYEEDFASALEQHLPAAVRHAFETVASRLLDKEDCIWRGSRGIVETRHSGEKPVGPAYHRAIKEWGTRHANELWEEIEGYLDENDGMLP